MFRSIISALHACVLSLRFSRELKVQLIEAKRYLGKSFSLGLCFAAFVKPTTIRGSLAAGRAAFISCSYDVVTDWRSFSTDLRAPFQRQLRELVPERPADLTMNLYWKELEGELDDDGLERGVVAVDFITAVVGSQDHFKQFGIRKLGHLLQIVDDIIDYEDDCANDELNCLTTSRADQHLAFFDAHRSQMLRLFKKDRIMRYTIELAAKKGRSFSSTSRRFAN